MLKIKVNGIEEALKKARATEKELAQGIGREVRKAALRVVNEAAKNAPRKDGLLINSIIASPKKIKAFNYTVGSDRPYAARQEYENKTKRGFFRKALFSERTRFREAIRKLLAKVGR
jgi:hypothetical protein